MSGAIWLRWCAMSCLVGLVSGSTAFGQSIRRVPAEFEPQQAIWLQWPGPFEKTYEPAYAEISNVIVQYQELHILHDTNAIRNQARAAISSAGGDPDHPNISWHPVPNENAWMRDNGPVYVVQDGALRIQDWEFDAWGGAFGNFPFADDDAVPVAVGNLLGMPVDPVNIVHERGNLEFNGVDTVVLNWNVIGNPNRGNGYANKAEAEVDLKNWFGVSQVVWADGPISGDDTGGHIDGIARFIDTNRAVVGNCTVNGHCQPGDADDQVYDATASSLAAAGFEVLRMDFQAEISHGGFDFDADYMNWAVGNGWVILVGFGNPATDAAAKSQLEGWFPGRDVHVIEMLDSWIAGGGVHCHTNDQPAASTIGIAPMADFSAGSTSGPAPHELQFFDLSSGNPTAWTWNFGDGGSSTEEDPIYAYAAEGTYTVSLTVASAAGSDVRVRTDYISVPEPGALPQLAAACLGLLALNSRRRRT
ncbi:MAG: agmatine deiminase family protein [Myxococcales bacterium]|nr:agmatine deiminase family protein [Myxococcales bacterium]